MFSYIIGEVKFIKEDFIVLENNYIGYKIFMPSRSISKFSINETHKIYTEFIVREDAVVLYGFIDTDELEMFLSLNQVSGIGPKAALSILSTIDVYEIKLAIIGNDYKTLTMAQGIGKKSASRIILELSDKVDVEDITNININREKTEIKTESKNFDVAVEALMNLGYTKQDASNAISKINNIEDMSLASIIKESLKRM